MNRRNLSLMLPIAAILAFSAPAQAGEKVTLEQVPAKVQETIRAHVQDGKLGTIEKDHEKGAIVYEAEYTTKDGTEYEIHVGEDGTLLTKEED